MAEKAYALDIYNTTTGEYETVPVTKDVFDTFRRTNWVNEKKNQRFNENETVMSNLIGGENGNYENFHEFIDYKGDPQEAMIEEMVHRSLYNILRLLPPADYELIYSLYFQGLTEKEFANRRGLTQQTIHVKKKRVLKKIKSFFDGECC